MSAPYKKKGRDSKTGVCKFYQQGRCGNKRCPFLHVSRGSHEDSSSDEKGTNNVMSVLLKLFLEKQGNSIYDRDSAVLNLSHLTSYADLNAIGDSLNLNNKGFCSALCRCISEVIVPPPMIYRFEGNGIKTIHQLTEAMRGVGLHENVHALSFAGNQIKDLDFVDCLKCFSGLKEVNFEGNPVVEHQDYKPKLKKQIPSITSIDRVSVQAPPLKLPWPKFYAPFGSPETVVFEDPVHSLFYTALQGNILQFIQSCVISPLDNSGGVDAVSDAYARNAVLTISFENGSAVSTSSSSSTIQRDVVREIVAFRLRQTDTNHNLLLGGKSSVVAIGRTTVCSTLENCVYPKNFSVNHLIHPSIDVAVLDNSESEIMKEPLSLVTMHGVIAWTYRPTIAATTEPITIQRNFTRVISVTTSSTGSWQVINDLISLFPCSVVRDTPGVIGVLLSEILYFPTECAKLVKRFSRGFTVPEPVVSILAKICASDYQLATILTDLTNVPLIQYEHAASLLNGDAMGSIVLCRLKNVFRLGEQAAVGLIQKVGLNWEALTAAASQ